jgi:hypothetical protein
LFPRDLDLQNTFQCIWMNGIPPTDVKPDSVH